MIIRVAMSSGPAQFQPIVQPSEFPSSPRPLGGRRNWKVEEGGHPPRRYPFHAPRQRRQLRRAQLAHERVGRAAAFGVRIAQRNLRRAHGAEVGGFLATHQLAWCRKKGRSSGSLCAGREEHWRMAGRRVSGAEVSAGGPSDLVTDWKSPTRISTPNSRGTEVI